jgi:hypothetical protein
VRAIVAGIDHEHGKHHFSIPVLLKANTASNTKWIKWTSDLIEGGANYVWWNGIVNGIEAYQGSYGLKDNRILMIWTIEDQNLRRAK